MRQRLPRREHRHGVADDAAQFGREVVGLPPGRGDDEQRPLPGQRTGDEQSSAGRTDQRQVLGPVSRQVDELPQRRRAQRQLR